MDLTEEERANIIRKYGADSIQVLMLVSKREGSLSEYDIVASETQFFGDTLHLYSLQKHISTAQEEAAAKITATLPVAPKGWQVIKEAK